MKIYNIFISNYLARIKQKFSRIVPFFSTVIYHIVCELLSLYLLLTVVLLCIYNFDPILWDLLLKHYMIHKPLPDVNLTFTIQEPLIPLFSEGALPTPLITKRDVVITIFSGTLCVGLALVLAHIINPPL